MTSQAVWGGVLDDDSLTANTVVRLESGCSGTLITPNVVLTAAHCLGKLADGTRPKPKIFVGPKRSAP